jgi:hypothetical protein
MIQFDPPIVAGTTLVRDAIQSQNYVTNVAGWIIQSDGDAEFNNVVVRGVLNGNNYIINNKGAFFYNGAPAFGTLIASIAAVAGVDDYGNPYSRVFNVGNQSGAHFGVDSFGIAYFVNALNQNVVQVNPSKQAIFVYNGAPSAATLAGVWAAAAGTDTFGKAYNAGITLFSAVGKVYLGGTDGVINSTGSTGNVINIEDGQISFYNLTDAGNALITQNLLLGSHGSVTIQSGADTLSALGTLFGIITVATAPTSGVTDSYPRTVTAAATLTDVANHYVSGAVVKSDLTGSVAEIWNTPSYNTGWSGGSTASANYQTLLFRKTAENELWLYGAVHATAAVPSNTVLTLPAAFRPKPTGGVGTASIFPAGSLVQVTNTDAAKASGRLNVMSNGAVVVGGFTIASGDNFYFDHYIPLGDIA